MSNEVLFSIVVPIYNVETYLRECLDSFVKQTSQDFKVFLIDDGSTDSSGEIAKEYAEKYPNLFEYHYQENKGLGGARNTGLALVNTKYLMFFDSDDFMANRAVENILETIRKYNQEIDIIFFNPIIYNMASHSYEPWHDAELMKKVFDGKDIINPSQTPMLMESEASVCRAIWRTDFLKGINLQFLEHVHWEDVPPHFEIMHNAKSAVFMPFQGAYFYRYNSGKQITSGNGKSRLDMEIIFKEFAPHFKDKSWSKDEKIYMIAFLSNYLLWSINCTDDEYLKKFVQICHKFFKKYVSLKLYWKYFKETKSRMRNKLMIFAIKSRILHRGLYTHASVDRKMRILKKLKKG